MNWITKNLFATVLLAITILGCGALIFLNVQAGSALAAKQAEFAEAQQKYDGLIDQDIFPSQENLKKVQALHDEYIAKTKELATHIADLQLAPAKDMSPQQFQDKLSQAVRDVEARAKDAHVELPEKFFLGFDNYSSVLPNAQAVPEIDVVLDTIVQTVNELIDSQLTKLEEIRRVPLAVEKVGTAAASEPSPAPKGAKKQVAATGVLERSTFALRVNGDPSRIREFADKTFTGKQLVTIQLASFVNEQSKGPPKGTAEVALGEAQPVPMEPNAVPSQPGDASSTDAPKSTINIILGEETVTADMRFQIIRLPGTSS